MRKQEGATDLAAQDILIAARLQLPTPGREPVAVPPRRQSRALAGPRRPGCGDGLAREAAGNGGSLWDHAAAVRPGLG